MDLKITKKRFEEHWVYDWIKYIAVVILCVFVVSLFYQVTNRKLKDEEEVRVVLFGTYIGELQAYNTDQNFNRYMKSVGLEDSKYLDYSMHGFAKLERKESFDASVIKLDGERELGLADIFILPKIDGNTYLDENGEIKEGAGYTFDMYVGMHRYFIPIDELISQEKAKGNPVATILEQKLIENSNYYYNCASKSVDASMTKYDQVTELYTDTDELGNPIYKNYGIDLNSLSQARYLIRDDSDKANPVCNYVLGVKKNSKSHAEALCFINWFIDNYK